MHQVVGPFSSVSQSLNSDTIFVMSASPRAYALTRGLGGLTPEMVESSLSVLLASGRCGAGPWSLMCSVSENSIVS